MDHSMNNGDGGDAEVCTFFFSSKLHYNQQNKWRKKKSHNQTKWKMFCLFKDILL